jgi:hypothetical protein
MCRLTGRLDRLTRFEVGWRAARGGPTEVPGDSVEPASTERQEGLARGLAKLGPTARSNTLSFADRRRVG